MDKKKKGLEGDDDKDTLVETGELLKVFTTAWESSLSKGKWNAGYRMMRRTLEQVKVEGEDEEEEGETFCSRFLSFMDILVRFEKSDAMAVVFDILGDEGRVTSCLLDPSVVSSGIISNSLGSIFMSGLFIPHPCMLTCSGALRFEYPKELHISFSRRPEAHLDLLRCDNKIHFEK